MHKLGSWRVANCGIRKQASLRRSISASYYALFHFLGEEATRLTVGTAHDRTELRQFAGRALVHGKMKNVREEFTRPTPRSDLLKPFWPVLQVAASADIVTVAKTFINLQDLRHAADYDLAYAFTRQDAETAADQAKDAIDAWNRVRAANEQLALLFALSLMLWPGLGGR